jgi:hypothetical protein
MVLKFNDAINPSCTYHSHFSRSKKKEENRAKNILQALNLLQSLLNQSPT